MNNTATENVSLAEAFAVVASICAPLSSESVSLAQAVGRVLAEPIFASEDQPAFDRSAVDGYAVALSDGSVRFKIVDFIRAGDWRPRSLAPGEAVHIATGGALPSTGLQVVMQENAVSADGFCTFTCRPTERNIRERGEDARKGRLLLSQGTRITSGTAALLASSGLVNPRVHRLPRVVHFTTGNEIGSPDSNPADGKIRDSNSTLIRTFLDGSKIPVLQRHLPEDCEPATEILQREAGTIANADLVLFSGGASVGEHDSTREMLTRLGFALRFGRTNLRPGRPLIVASEKNRIAFGLPGNPLAHFVILHVLVRAALDAFSGIPVPTPVRSAPLAASVAELDNPRETLWPAQLEVVSGREMIRLLPWRSSGDLTALATANAIARIPPGTSPLASGSSVEFFPTRF